LINILVLLINILVLLINILVLLINILVFIDQYDDKLTLLQNTIIL